MGALNDIVRDPNPVFFELLMLLLKDEKPTDDQLIQLRSSDLDAVKEEIFKKDRGVASSFCKVVWITIHPRSRECEGGLCIG